MVTQNPVKVRGQLRTHDKRILDGGYYHTGLTEKIKPNERREPESGGKPIDQMESIQRSIQASSNGVAHTPRNVERCSSSGGALRFKIKCKMRKKGFNT